MNFFAVLAFTCTAALMGSIFLLPLIALQAYVISDLWNLFISPWIHIEAPSLWVMAGVLLTVRAMAYGVGGGSKRDDKKESSDPTWTEILLPFVGMYLGVLITWGLGHFIYWLSTV